MKKALLFVIAIIVFASCGKDEKINGIEISGKYVEAGITSNPPVWEFLNGIVKSGTTKRGDYTIKDNKISILTPENKTYVFEASINGDILDMDGVSGNFHLNSELKSKYKFKRYVEK